VDIAKASVQDARELVASPLSWAGSDGHTAIQMTLGFKVDGVNPCFVALASDWSQRQMNGQGIVPTPPSLCGI
jgi:hypothetical protein